MIVELEGRVPQMHKSGLYHWDDLVANKINECVRALNNKEGSQNVNPQSKSLLCCHNCGNPIKEGEETVTVHQKCGSVSYE